MPKAGSASGPDQPSLDNSTPTAASSRSGGRLGPTRRLRKSDEFAAILKAGVRGRSEILGVALVPATGRGRIGISASTKVGGAVGRNRARRLVKESYRKTFSKSAPHDIVVTVNPKIQGSSANEVRQALDEAISDALNRRGRLRRPSGSHH